MEATIDLRQPQTEHEAGSPLLDLFRGLRGPMVEYTAVTPSPLTPLSWSPVPIASLERSPRLISQMIQRLRVRPFICRFLSVLSFSSPNFVLLEASIN